MTEDFYSDLDRCIADNRPNALLVPWLKDSRKSLLAAAAGLKAAGWAWVEGSKHYERGGWSLFLRSQGEISSPIAQFNRLAWGVDEVDAWGLRHLADGSVEVSDSFRDGSYGDDLDDLDDYPAAPAPLDAPHDYVAGRGDTCGVCGKSITHPLHQPDLLAIPDQQTPLVLTSPENLAPTPRISGADPLQFTLF